MTHSLYSYAFSVSHLRAWACGTMLLVAGCAMPGGGHPPAVGLNEPSIPPQAVALDPSLGRELSKVAQPEYIIEPPDILLLNAKNVAPRAPYRIGMLDVLMIEVQNALPDRPISGDYTVQPGGVVELGPPYGTVHVAGMTVDEATQALEEHLRAQLQSPRALFRVVATASSQLIGGEHIVGPDGMVSLGLYGKVFVAGTTQGEARRRIEAHLASFLEQPEISVDVFAYNSKAYYIITQGAGFGDRVVRLPSTGGETVLDAIAEINGLESISSKRIWIARPAPDGVHPPQILPVDWTAISQLGATGTNYQIYPGDRLYIAEDRLVAMDSFVSKVLSPFERIMGFISLGTQTVSGIKFFNQRGQRGFNDF